MKKDRKNCDASCKGRIISKERGVYCPCLEKKLPKVGNQSINARYTGTIEIYWLSLWIKQNEPTTREILNTLYKYGLEIYEIKLVYYRVVKGMTFKKLVSKFGWVNRHQASYHFQKALLKLRVGGFKL